MEQVYLKQNDWTRFPKKDLPRLTAYSHPAARISSHLLFYGLVNAIEENLTVESA